MIGADEKKVLRSLYKVLTDEQFEAACAEPDPYLAGMCVALGIQMENAAASVPEPEVSGKIGIRVRWQVGRAARVLLDAGKTRPMAVIRAFRWSHSTLYTALAVYQRNPDGRIAAQTIEEAAGYAKKKGKPANAQSSAPATPVSVQGLDAAILDLKALAKKSGLPLKAEQIADVAAKRGVNPLVLMGAWGNTVLQQGAPTSQQVIEALQRELAARSAQFATIMGELAAKEERLAAQQEALEKLSGQVCDLEGTVNDLVARLGQIGDLGAKLADFFQSAGALSPRTDVIRNIAA